MKAIAFGCFNIVHAGHIDMFQHAKALTSNGTLIVAICADNFVKAMKGFAVPILHRMQVLKAIRDIDIVDIYGIRENTVSLTGLRYKEVIKRLHVHENELVDFYQPDMVVFGDDKPADFYSHIELPVRFVQTPRINAGISSTEILKGLNAAQPTME